MLSPKLLHRQQVERLLHRRREHGIFAFLSEVHLCTSEASGWVGSSTQPWSTHRRAHRWLRDVYRVPNNPLQSVCTDRPVLPTCSSRSPTFTTHPAATTQWRIARHRPCNRESASGKARGSGPVRLLGRWSLAPPLSLGWRPLQAPVTAAPPRLLPTRLQVLTNSMNKTTGRVGVRT